MTGNVTNDHKEPFDPVDAPGDPTEQVGDWSGRLPVEAGPTRRHRRAQGLWRTERLKWPAGPPLTRSTRERYPTLPNYLAEEHEGQTPEAAGVNLMSPAAREYARERLPQVEAIQGTAEPQRLYRNLLSSQPLAFSIAGELRAHPDAAVSVLRELTRRPVTGLEVLSGPDSVVPEEQNERAFGRPLQDYTLTGIEAEWFPPRWAHTDDRSGFDIAACLAVAGGIRLLVSVEVKYTDSFSTQPVSWTRYEDQLSAIGLSEKTTEELVKAGCSQVLRQVMITASVGRIGLVPDVGESGRVQEVLTVVLARGDDHTARKVVDTLSAAVSVPVQYWSHADLFAAAARQPALADWAARMAERYLAES